MAKKRTFAQKMQDLEQLLAGLKLHEQELPQELKDIMVKLEGAIPVLNTLDEEQELAKAALHQKTDELNGYLDAIWGERSSAALMLKGKYGADGNILEDFGLSPRKPAEPVEAPPPPATIHVTECTSSSVSLEWDSSPTKRVYEIWRARSYARPQHETARPGLEKRRPNDADYELVATSVERKWTDNDVEVERTFWYKVRAVNAGGESDFTEAVNATPAG